MVKQKLTKKQILTILEESHAKNKVILDKYEADGEDDQWSSRDFEDIEDNAFAFASGLQERLRQIIKGIKTGDLNADTLVYNIKYKS